MRFRQYIPAVDAQTRQKIFDVYGMSPHQVDDDMANFTVAYEIHASNRRPFYRVYPGVTAAMLRLGIEKIDISEIRPPINGLALEFAEGHFLTGGHLDISGMLIVDLKNFLLVEFVYTDNQRGYFKFPRVHRTVLDWIKTKSPVEQTLMSQTMQITFGVCAIPQSDTDLIKPLVLNRDKEKFDATGDVKFIERAKRNGVHGWDIGRDIPTPEEMETLRQQTGEFGRKSPHWRTGYFALRHTGEGRSVPVVRWIKETFVNKNLLKEVPHGYYDKEKTDDT